MSALRRLLAAILPPQRFVVCDPALARLSDALAIRSDFDAVGRALSAAAYDELGVAAHWFAAEQHEQYERDREALRDLGEEEG